MKKLLLTTLVLIAVITVMVSFTVVSQQGTGRFTIGNEDPFVVADTFAVQDGSGPDWDSVKDPNIDTHNVDTPIRFNVKDNNPDTLDVRLCIGTSADPSGVGDCNVVNYDFPVVAPGAHIGAQGAELTYDYNTDPTGTLEGVSESIGLTQGDCSLGVCSKEFFTDIIVDDGNGGVITFQDSFFIVNNVPDTPSDLITPLDSDLIAPVNTHDPLSQISWTAADSDTGGVDSWPADSALVYHVQVGETVAGDTDYLADPSASSPTSTITSPIPWGVPGTTEARKTVQVRIWTTDDLGIDSDFYDTTLDLVDNLPVFENLYLSRDALVLPDDSCEDFDPQRCVINPTTGDLTSVNIQLSISDSDADCSTLSHNAELVLCLVDSLSVDVCDAATNNYRTYPLTFLSAVGPDCEFSTAVPIPVGDPLGIEFYVAPGEYKLDISASSQSGESTVFDSGSFEIWEYGLIQAPDYPSEIFLGDRVIDGGDDIQLGEWNPGLSLTILTNLGNSALNIEWDATDASTTGTESCNPSTTTCWDLTSNPDLIIDDDNACISISDPVRCLDTVETSLAETVIAEYTQTIPVAFGTLDICDSLTCNSPTLDETLDTYFHINPPIGLEAGDYQTAIRFYTA